MPPLPDTAAVRDGRLTVGGVALSDLAREHGTPLHVYDAATLRARARAYGDALAGYPAGGRIAFACKALASVAVLRLLAGEGLGADVASAGEIAFARAAGIPGEGLVVHGNNKSEADLRAALDAGAALVVVDHPAEPATIDRLAARAGVVQDVLVRVTPGIDAGTHPSITTGHAASKFGFAPAAALEAIEGMAALAHVRPAGLHVHLGSQIADLTPFLSAVRWLAGYVEDGGLGELPILDVGGGLAVAYVDGDVAPEPGQAAERVVEAVADAWLPRGLPLPELVFEPGRSIAAPAGVTLYTVGALKTAGDGAAIAAVDGGMSDNPRPALYGARYQAYAVDRASAPAERRYALVGKHCESGDVVIDGAELPELRAGDVVAVAATGAYNASMASTYNGVPRAAAVLVEDGTARPITRRETVDELLAREL
jgi:diaminopimelate decarboxylase